jgi:hypothetical protein
VDEDKDGTIRNQGISTQGDKEQKKKCGAHPDPSKDSRDEEEMDDQRDDVGQDLVIHKGAVNGLLHIRPDGLKRLKGGPG